MTEPINLNRERKRRDRAARKKQADENAVKFGRTKGERMRDDHDADRAGRDHDGHRLDDT